VSVGPGVSVGTGVSVGRGDGVVGGVVESDGLGEPVFVGEPEPVEQELPQSSVLAAPTPAADAASSTAQSTAVRRMPARRAGAVLTDAA
jgi:hypothetical protein